MCNVLVQMIVEYMVVCDLMKQKVDKFEGEEGLLPREGGENPLSNRRKKMGLKKNIGWKIG